MTAGRPETSQTLDRGLQLLLLLAEHDGGRTVTELATALGVARPVVYRLLATLEGRHFVVRTDDGRVRLGLGVLALATRVQPMLREVATPLLRALADEVGATAHLTVADGDEGLAVVVVEPQWTQFHVAYRVGSRHPLGRGAAGRAVLALRAGRGDLASSDGELQEGAHGVSVAWRVGTLEGSVGVVSLTPLDVEAVGAAVRRTADDLTARLAS
ncbi:MAG: IclR family transcriptional regulator [Angustibacter sp.]